MLVVLWCRPSVVVAVVVGCSFYRRLTYGHGGVHLNGFREKFFSFFTSTIVIVVVVVVVVILVVDFHEAQSTDRPQAKQTQHTRTDTHC